MANIQLPDYINFNLREVKWIQVVWITTKYDFLHTIVLGYLFVCLENKSLYAWGFTKNPQYSLQKGYMWHSDKLRNLTKMKTTLKLPSSDKIFHKKLKTSHPQPSWHCGFQIEIENRSEWPKVIGKATMGWEAASTWGLYSTKVG